MQVVVASVRGTDGRGGSHVGGVAGVTDTGCGEIGLHGVGQAVHLLLFGAPVDIQVVLLGGGGEIDDGHRALPSCFSHPMRGPEEVLYPAMEDFAIDIMLGKESSARSIRLDLPHFTLVGATTRAGLLTAPLRDRFGVVQKLEFYTQGSCRSL